MKQGKKTRHPGVYRLTEGQWRIQATVTGPDGSRVARRQIVEGDLEDAVIARAQLVGELRQSRSPAQQTLRTTIADCAVRWLEVKAASVRPKTAHHYRAVLGKHILPYMGNECAEELTRAHVQGWVQWAERRQDWRGRQYSKATLMGHRRVLRNFVRDVAADLDIADPTRRVKPPQSKVRAVREKETLTASQLASLLATISKAFPRWYSEAFVMAMTGMRAGEVYALRWRDVEWGSPERGGRITVCRSQGFVEGEWHESDTKTGDPRVIPLTAGLQGVLRRHRRAEGRIGDQDELVFCAPDGGPRYYTGIAKALRLASDMCGIDVRVGPQVLRRTYNTLGRTVMNEQTLQDLNGHCDGEMTQRYHRAPLELKAAGMSRYEALVMEGGNTSG